MFGAFGFGQGYFAQGPMIVIVPIAGPIHVESLRHTKPEAETLLQGNAQATGIRQKTPAVNNWEQH